VNGARQLLPCSLRNGFWGVVVSCLLATALAAKEREVIILTPHVESIREEFGRGFAEWHARKFGESARAEWRVFGGTSESLRFVQSEFASKPAGIGLDIFFGGGPEPFLLLADKKLLEPCPLPETLMAGIPPMAGSAELYDAERTWYGAVLSSFGILQNTRLQAQLKLPRAHRWEELASPQFFGWVGAGDPRKSGTMNNMYEAMLQAYGWERGWQLLHAIGGNTRKFDMVSSSTAKDVVVGETVYAFAIDFYGFTQIAAAGRSNLTFVLPEDFTSLSADGIAVLKGAPNLETARRFVEFVMSEEGQKLWLLPRGHPEGPKMHGIDRMAVRPALYEKFRGQSNIEYSPFALKQSFRYDAALSRDRRDVLSALFGAVIVDTHAELKDAWAAIIRRGARPEEIAALGTVPLTEAEALALAKKEWKDPAFRNAKKIEWQTWAQKKYRALAVPAGS
jgi:ABC-type Fe3+ transport system substrate-binding protein